MVVEDDAPLRKALAYRLEAEGFIISICASGEALLAMNLPSGPAVLVVAEALPGLSGSKALLELRRRGVTLPAILTATDPKPGLLKAAHRLDATIVEKPLLSDALLCQIRAALDRTD